MRFGVNGTSIWKVVTILWMTSENKKKLKKISKKSSQTEFDYSDSELHYETITSVFYRLQSFRNTQLVLFVASNVNLKYFFIENILIWRKVTLKVNKIMPNIPSHKTSILDNSSKKKTKFKSIFLFLNSTLEQLFNDTTHISLRWIYRLVKIDWTKKTIWVYSSSPYKWVGTIRN